MKDRSVQSGRRTFMKLLALAGGAGALFRAGAAPPSPPADARPVAGRSAAGYRETEHVRKYYSKARI